MINMVLVATAPEKIFKIFQGKSPKNEESYKESISHGNGSRQRRKIPPKIPPTMMRH
jgi:hypothetical protein